MKKILLILMICSPLLGMECRSLHDAIKAKDLVAVEKILESGSSGINNIDKDGDTALHLAIRKNFCIKELLDHRDSRIDIRNKSKLTAFDEAIRSKDVEIVKILLASQKNMDILCLDEDVLDPLIYADKNDLVDILRLLRPLYSKKLHFCVTMVQALILLGKRTK